MQGKKTQDREARQSRTHLEDFGVGDGDDRNNVGGDGDGGDDDYCGCDSGCGWQEAEVTLLPREGTEVHHLSKQTLHHTQATYEMFFFYKIYNRTPAVFFFFLNIGGIFPLSPFHFSALTVHM